LVSFSKVTSFISKKQTGWVDYLATALMLFFLIYETIADIQQWNFQSRKWALINQGKELAEPYKKGFLTTGLWAHSRHPNYFAEQAIWVSFYIFSIASGASRFNWSIRKKYQRSSHGGDRYPFTTANLHI